MRWLRTLDVLANLRVSESQIWACHCHQVAQTCYDTVVKQVASASRYCLLFTPCGWCTSDFGGWGELVADLVALLGCLP